MISFFIIHEIINYFFNLHLIFYGWRLIPILETFNICPSGQYPHHAPVNSSIKTFFVKVDGTWLTSKLTVSSSHPIKTSNPNNRIFKYWFILHYIVNKIYPTFHKQKTELMWAFYINLIGLIDRWIWILEVSCRG